MEQADDSSACSRSCHPATLPTPTTLSHHPLQPLRAYMLALANARSSPSLHPTRPKPFSSAHVSQGAADTQVAGALLAWTILKQALTLGSRVGATVTSFEEALPLLADARRKAREQLPRLLQGAQAAGWNVDDAMQPVLVFGYIGNRAIWPRTASSSFSSTPSQ